MPLIKSGSKKALQENIKTEMDSNPGKDNRAQNLAIAYAVQRKNKRKKMADGGNVSLEQSKMRPNPYEINEHDQDIMATSEKRPMPEQEFRDEDEIRRNRDKHMIPREKYLYEGGDVEKPQDMYDEMEIERNKDKHADDISASDEKRPMPEEEDHDKENIMRNSSKHSIDDQDWDDRGRGQASEEHEYEMKRPDYEIDDDSMQNHLHDEEDDLMESEKPGDSLIERIMLKRGGMIKRYADGGQVDLQWNADEDPNNEDQMSYEALKKENYSESDMLESEQPEDSNEHDRDIDSDDYDMIDSIRKKIKSKRGF